MTTALARTEQSTGGALAMWDAEQLSVIKDLICPGASDSELALFGQVCQRTGLDPFSKQIYGLMRWDGRKKREVLSIQTSIDGFRLQAQRSRDYAGQEGPQWCGEDGVWRDVWLSKEHPSAARVGVYRKGWSRPVWGIAIWSEYAQTNKEGQVTGLWRNMPANMLAKCAESQALRKAFPAELSGLYAPEEMDQADNSTTPAQYTTPKPQPEPAPIEGEVLDGETADPVWPEPHESKWQAGVKLAQELGAAIPKKERGALPTLAANVRARQVLFDELADVIKVANDMAQEEMYAIPDDASTWTEEEFREQIATIQKTINDASAAA